MLTFSPVIRVFIVAILLLQLSASYAYDGIVIPYWPQPVDSSLAVSGPAFVKYNEEFVLKVLLSEGSYGYTSIMSIEEELPEGFVVVKRGEPIRESNGIYSNMVFLNTLKAPGNRVDKAKIVYKMRYFDSDKKIRIATGKCEIYVGSYLRDKYRLDPDNVSPNYNGDIKSAAIVESLPTLVPLGFFVLGEKREEATWINTYAGDSFIPKLIETVAFGVGISEMKSNQSKSILCAVIYLYTLIFHDMPNLYNAHEAKMEIAKFKREGKI